MKTCFVISPIGEQGTPVRRRADGVLNELIRPAMEPLGYRVERADLDRSPGIVTEIMIACIVDAELVIADLTDTNPNVMYELAIRHAIAKPVIQMMELGGRLPFDILGQNTIFFDPDLAGRRNAIEALTEAHTAILSNPNLGNPIRRALDIRELAERGTPHEKVLLELIKDLRQVVARLEPSVGPLTTRGSSDRPLDSARAAAFRRVRFSRHLLDAGVTGISLAIADDDSVEATGKYHGQVLSATVRDPQWNPDDPESGVRVGREIILQLLDQVTAIKDTEMERGE